MLDKEFQYYLEHQAELVEKYNGRYLVIKDEAVVGNYATLNNALQYARQKYELGTFLIQKCSEGDKDYTAKYHSRVRMPLASVQSVHS